MVIGRRELKQVDDTKIIVLDSGIYMILSDFLLECYFLKGYIKKITVSRQSN